MCGHFGEKGFIENLARDCGRIDDGLAAGMMVSGVITAEAEGGYLLPARQGRQDAQRSKSAERLGNSGRCPGPPLGRWLSRITALIVR